ncbi:MAG: nickel pincer cofactor biosynthesis protein LarC [Bacillota bacterium]|nr:nickel pincer cofactor biosynthesis protein LarC [Bacillota bacterium]
MDKTLYFHCFSGISGDMCLGSLVDLGVDPDFLVLELKKLPLSGYQLDFTSVVRRGIGAIKVDVNQVEKQTFRHLPEIEALINNSDLSSFVKKLSIATFQKLALAEASVHQTTIDKVHFHEVGALDAIIDIVGTVICIEYLNPKRIISSSLPLGGGFAKCEHGVIPIPAPATLELLKGVPVNDSIAEGEVVTPTGAAIITTLTDTFTTIPSGIVTNTGYGAGTKDFSHPNVLRTILIEEEHCIKESSDSTTTSTLYLQDEIVVMKASIDDMTGESLGYLLELLLDAGALDCYYTPIYMKKNRPAYQLTVLLLKNDESCISDIIFANSSTLGFRIDCQKRFKLQRSFDEVILPYGRVNIKLGHVNNNIVQVSPEYEDCAKLAKATGHSLRKIFQDALSAYWNNSK